MEESEKDGIIAGGWIFAACKQLMSGSDSTSSFKKTLDVLMCKYGMPAASNDTICTALEKHSTAFGSKDSEPVDDGVMRRERKKALKEEIRESIRGVCDRIYQGSRFRLSNRLPSLSACFEWPREHGGQLTYLVDEFLHDAEIDCNVFISEPTLYYVADYKGKLEQVYMTQAGTVLLDQFQDYVDDLVLAILDEDVVRCKAVAIPEPLKVRVITKAMAAITYRSVEIQRNLHRCLRRVPAFQLTGEPVSIEMIQRVFPLKGKLPDGWEYVSGDYEAATDRIRRSLSRYTWSCIASIWHLSPFWVEMGHRMLEDHIIEYPRWSGVASIEQKRGQPMGSPMSFPVLCIVNAACYLAAHNLSPQALFEPGLLVNGDDIVFAHEKKHYNTWWEYNKVAGLLPSVGKNYRSARFLNVNSTTFRVTDGEWKQMHYINLAILRNVVRKGLNAGTKTGIPWSFGKPLYDALVKGHSDDLQKKLRSILARELHVPDWMPLDLPQMMGGPGFIIPSCVSEEARKMAGHYFCTKITDKGPMPVATPKLPAQWPFYWLTALSDYEKHRTRETVYCRVDSSDSIDLVSQDTCRPQNDGGILLQVILEGMGRVSASDATPEWIAEQYKLAMGASQSVVALRSDSALAWSIGETVNWKDPRFIRCLDSYEKKLHRFYRKEYFSEPCSEEKLLEYDGLWWVKKIHSVVPSYKRTGNVTRSCDGFPMYPPQWAVSYSKRSRLTTHSVSVGSECPRDIEVRTRES
jgi:hypothetical protein